MCSWPKEKREKWWTEWGKGECKLQALVYDVLPPATVIVDYAIGLEKLSANEQFFDHAQTAVGL